MTIRGLSLFVAGFVVGSLALAGSARAFCFNDNFGFDWDVDRHTGTGTATLVDPCGPGTTETWDVSGTVTKTGRRERDVNLTATNASSCVFECEPSFTVTGHFSRKHGSGTWFADVLEPCVPDTLTLPWEATKHKCP